MGLFTLSKRRLLWPGTFAVIMILAIAAGSAVAAGDNLIFFREDFNSLENWRLVHFPKVAQHTAYIIEREGDQAFLKAESSASASALVHKQEFNVYRHGRARWRWKVGNLYRNVRPDKKSGDDYPIRVYVNFRYNPEEARAFERVKYGIAKQVFGEYPPHSALTYVWANSEDQNPVVTNPYTDRAKVIALRKGNGNVGTWQYEEVNILEDYRRAFGTDPPAAATISIMNDSDDTGQGSVSYVDFIEVLGEAR